MAVGRSSRVLVIGLDVGDGKLIRQWIHEGHLPVLGSLLAHGTWAWLGTPAEVLHISGWPSLYTGTLPGKHGVYYPFQPAPGQQGACRIGPGHYGQPPVWRLLDTAGLRCVVFDAPYTFPVEGFKGVQIFEWGTWAWYWRRMSSPSPIIRDLNKRCGPYPLGFEANQIGFAPLDLSDLRTRLAKGASLKARATRWLMSRFPWDFFLVVFGETHPAAHYFWSHSSSQRDAGPSSLREIYVAIDNGIGEILEGVGDDVTVFVVSGDGVGPNYAAWHLLPEVLKKLNLTSMSGQVTNGNQEVREKADLFRSLRDLVPSGVRQALSRRFPVRWRDSLTSRWAVSNIDWHKTRAFCLPTDLEGCIRINLKDREPDGVVNLGSEYENVCDELTAQLKKLVNPRTQSPAVRDVLRTDHLFAGERRHYLPDLVVTWSEDATIDELASQEIGTLKGVSPDGRAGTHKAPGFMLARGPKASHGYVLESGRVVDLTPTILAEFGLPRPDHMDGCAWTFS